MGLADIVINKDDGSQYAISTLRNPLGIWEIAVVQRRGLLGWKVPKMLCGVIIASPDQTLKSGAEFIFDLVLKKRIVWFTVNEASEPFVREIHSIVKTIVEDRPRKEWIWLFWSEVRDFLRAHKNLRMADVTESQVKALMEQFGWRGKPPPPARR